MQGFERQQQGIAGNTQVRLGGIHSPNLRALVVQEQDPPDLTLRVLGTGRVWVGHTALEFTDTNTPALSAPAAQDRIALLTLDSAGALAWTYGAEAVMPTAPALPYDELVLCAVYERPAMTSVTDEDNGTDAYVLADYRPFLYIAPVWCTFVTRNDETSELPNSYRASGGAGITLSYAANVQTIEWDGLTVRHNAITVGTRRQVNLIEGSGVTIGAVDDGMEIDVTITNASPGVTDHGALTGLADDDHPQYLNTTRHLAIGDGNPHHAAASVYGAPLTLSGQQIRFNYDPSDFGVSGNNLYIKDSGIDHGGLTGLSDNDHTQYVNAAGSGLSLTGQALSWNGLTVRDDGVTRGTRRQVNFVSGSGISVSASDDGTEIDVTITNSSPGVTDHTLLSNLNSVNYYHLTQAHHTDLTDGGDTTLHYHTTDRARANHTGTQPSSTISDFAEAAQDAVGGILTNTASVDLTYNDAAGTITAVVLPAGVDHGGLAGLLDNDHTQYVNAAGSGLNLAGQTLSWDGLAVYDTGVLLGTRRAMDFHDTAPINIAVIDSGTDMEVYVSLSYVTSDFGLSGSNLYIKDSGVDHGGLAGLADDDHLQYLNTARHLAIGDSNPHHTQLHSIAIDSVNHSAADVDIGGNYFEGDAFRSNSYDVQIKPLNSSYAHVRNKADTAYKGLACSLIVVQTSARIGGTTTPTDTLNVDGNADVTGNLDAHQGVDIDAGYALTIGGDCEWHRDAANQLGTPDSVRVDSSIGVGRAPGSVGQLLVQGAIGCWDTITTYGDSNGDICCGGAGGSTIRAGFNWSAGTVWVYSQYQIGGSFGSPTSIGATGTFVDNSGNTITVVGGIITSLS